MCRDENPWQRVGKLAVRAGMGWDGCGTSHPLLSSSPTVIPSHVHSEGQAGERVSVGRPCGSSNNFCWLTVTQQTYWRVTAGIARGFFFFSLNGGSRIPLRLEGPPPRCNVRFPGDVSAALSWQLCSHQVPVKLPCHGNSCWRSCPFQPYSVLLTEARCYV